jgi:hypothetical protein
LSRPLSKTHFADLVGIAATIVAFEIVFFVLGQVLHYKSAILYNVFVFVCAELSELVLQIAHELYVLLTENNGLLDSQLHFLKFSWDSLGLKF